MSTRGAGISSSALKPFLDKEYRDSYLDTYVRASVAYQIQAIREQMGLSQADFGQLIEKPQNVVSRLEDTEYSGSVKTLIAIAQHLGIGLEIRFRSYPHILQSDVSSAAYRVDTIDDSYRKANAFSAARSDVAQPTTGNVSVWAMTSGANWHAISNSLVNIVHSNQEYLPWPTTPQLGNRLPFSPGYVITNIGSYMPTGT